MSFVRSIRIPSISPLLYVFSGYLRWPSRGQANTLKLGGDGTLLYASWLFQRIVPPVLSLSLGSLGFLTKFDYNDFRDTLTTAFRDGITVSLRLRFEGTIMRTQNKDRDEGKDLVDELIGEEAENKFTHKPDLTYEILNDIVVDRGPNPSMFITQNS